jgi:hypothetical protein
VLVLGDRASLSASQGWRGIRISSTVWIGACHDVGIEPFVVA